MADPSSPHSRIYQKTPVERKLDYLNSLLARREQSIVAQDFVARQTADEEKLKRLEEKLVQP
ncbi:uncharacterized protein A1O5_12804 [Cladophialophora psammophila CBS 110553]|uniref:Uncharacterized protein n=1 Tax=Cladophialophora psammophila CBS 110553 TaxID=1182543 RepID=W9VPX9_9EURO|nr:uncharacterized protein A1O5_12804 [Cladophialophora psammophila CBS 110553]EXJ55065.1 hypothetical protein A1O5_12804 [Cladophialophora psammophila CBS 110553]